MKRIMLFEAYKDLISDKGATHIVYDIDDEYFLKTPKNLDTAEMDIIGFKSHIDYMQKHPDVFPDVKMLSPRRASVEKLDTKGALDQIDHIYALFMERIKIEMPAYSVSKSFIISDIYEQKVLLDVLNSIEDPICQKWATFINYIKGKLSDYEDMGFDLDLNSGNFGIDRQGDIKLLDF